MKILLTEQQLNEGVDRLARQIRDHYAGKPLEIVGVLIGSVILVADLIRRLDIPLKLDIVQARSYNHMYRNLPYLAALEPHEIQQEPQQ